MDKRRILLRSYEILLCLIILSFLVIPLSIFIVIKLFADGKPLFYNSKRLGKNRKAFTVYKFRSMVNDRSVIENYLKSIRSYGFEKIPLDAVVYTRMGRFFEKFQIVEFLQIFNVLEGHMSLIGYRPLPLTRVLQLEEELGVEKMEFRHSVKPGITGISQIVGKASLSNSERVNLENNYNFLVQTKSEGKVILINTLIIIETVCQIFFKRNFFIGYINREINSCQPRIATQQEEFVTEKEEYIPAYSRRSLRAAFSGKSRSRIAS